MSLTFALVVLSYLLGSIPFGLLLMRYSQGVDVRTIGSGNIGATNVLRSGNKKIAAATLLLDMSKGAIAVIFALLVTKSSATVPVLCAFAAVTGHIFPIWLGFKGGKGVATALGVLLPLSPFLFLSVALTWLIVAKLLRISSLSAFS